MTKILIIDDASFMRKILTKIFIQKGYEVVGEAVDADSGIAAYKEIKPDLVTMDICMPLKSGIEAINEIIAYDKNAKILVCSALGQEILVMEAIEAGAKDFIVKPFKKDKVLQTIEKIISD